MTIEFCIKGICKRCSIAYPPEHEVSDQLQKVLAKVSKSSEKTKTKIVRLFLIGKMWEHVHSIATYGKSEISPDKIFFKKDAEHAMDCANEAWWTLNQIIIDSEKGEFKTKNE